MYSVIPYQAAYALSVSQIFHEAIHAIDDLQYSPAHKAAWSAKPRSSYHWHKRLSRSRAWIVVDTSQIVAGRPKCCGFINLETRFYSLGYIDSLYVHPEHQGNGLARALYEGLELWAKDRGYPELSVDASILSKEVFLSYGFKVKHRSYQEKLGQVIMGFLMSKSL
ncbi:GNAT family N-acetyltransferase [Shewanella violacea]|uniref:Acetyltransferase, GNAT family n=1 Tax=Shewanella violacea (strain JCM 10179 / CIP 106290 / LMG 19151 / DSS12) TaxID=637905 RepID=D4ZI41_SHEVD|nr:GNAT family N-acetyltransferase [Shewanella violacea]BAJ01340.1 acetyltransferase, GNAT family [Shewanella violacea DSS12]